MDPTKINLNRSFSEPDVHTNPLYFRRTIVEEFYPSQHHDKSLIRYYSYDKIIDNSRTLIQTHCSVIDGDLKRSSSYIDNHTEHNYYKSADNSIDIPKNEVYTAGQSRFKIPKAISPVLDLKKYCEQELTPMEVDSDEEVQYNTEFGEKDISQPQNYTVPDYARKQNVGSRGVAGARRLTDVRVTQNEKLEKSNVNFTIIFASVIIALIGWLCYYIMFDASPQKQKVEQIQEIISDLDQILFQDHVKEIIIKNIYDLQEKNILVFVGTTGVGKTYTANLVRKHFPQEYVIDINFLLETHLNVDNIKASLRSDGCYFITIDDLKLSNLGDVISYISKLPNRCMLVVPIFNIHQVGDNLVYNVNYDHFKEIDHEFKDKFSSHVEIVLFNDISRDNLELWLKDQIKGRGIYNEEETIFSVLDDHDVNIHGFKGLIGKIKILESR